MSFVHIVALIVVQTLLGLRGHLVQIRKVAAIKKNGNGVRFKIGWGFDKSIRKKAKSGK